MSPAYRYNRDPDWNPAKNPPAPREAVLKGSARVLHERRQERVKAFAEAREAGKTVGEAAEAAGVNIRTGRVYEAERLAALAERAS